MSNGGPDDRRKRLRRDVAVYRLLPPTAEEIEFADHGSHGDIDDDTDWELLYPDVGTTAAPLS